MNSSNLISCDFCSSEMMIYDNVTFAECPSCYNVNRIIDVVSRKYTSYNLKGKLRLDEKLKTNKFLFKNPQDFLLQGIMELEFNESSLYLFFTYQPTPKIIAYFEFEWYELERDYQNESNATIKSWKSGDYESIFIGDKSYIINLENNFTFSLIGQVSLPFFENNTTIVEHVFKENLYFSFFEKKNHFLSFQLLPIGKKEISDIGITHYPYIYTCQHCGRENNIMSYPFSMSFACLCGQGFYFDTKGEVKKEKRFSKYTTPFIQLGTKCNFDGIEFETIGHTEKKDSDNYCWDEYTLWNPIEGFNYLSVYNGHWILLKIEKLKTFIPINQNYLKNYIYEDNEEYAIFNDYKSTINRCQGVFAGNILNDKEYSGIEYIAPPSMWAFEKPLNESITAFKGRYINNKELEKAFSYNINLPFQYGIGAIEKLPGTLNIGIMLLNFFLGLVLLFLIQIFTMTSKQEKLVYSGDADLINYPATKLVSPPFNLENSHNTLELKLEGSVNNSWLENDVELINLDNGNTINIEQGVEFYSGYDSEGAWSEGSRSNEKVISFLPKGKYQISFTPTYENTNQTIGYSVAVKKDVSTFNNFWYILLMIGVPCIIFALYNYNTEVNRWRNSNYNSYIEFDYD